MRNFLIAASLLVLLGCQTTKQADYTPSEVYSGREELRDYLAEVMANVCVSNLGSAEAIDRSVASYTIEEPILSETVLAGEQVTAVFYPLVFSEFGKAMLINADGLVCGIWADRTLRMPQHFRSTLNITMEQPVWDMMNYEDVELTYGYRDQPENPLRQFSTRGEKNEIIDSIELLAPEMFRSDKMFMTELKGLERNAEMRPELADERMVFSVLEDVCAAHMGDYEGMRLAASALAGTSGVTLEKDQLDWAGHSVTFHLLTVKGMETVSFLSLVGDASFCGYWEKGKPGVGPDVFERFSATDITTRIEDELVLRLGYSAELDLGIVSIIGVEGDEAIRGSAFLKKELLENLPTELLSVLPRRI